MTVEELALPGVRLLTRAMHRDRRGVLSEVFKGPELQAMGISGFVQDNLTRSTRHVVRGLHWQVQRPQGKLVTVVRGAIVDVVVDVRKGSPTFGRSITVALDDASGHQLWIPPGYAHGFCVVSDVADVLYKNTDVWVPGDGRGVRWNCPTLAIHWPTAHPILSDKDAALPMLGELSPSDLPTVDLP